MPPYVNPYDMLSEYLKPALPQVVTGVKQGMELASLPSEIGYRKAQIPLVQAETEAKQAQLEAMRAYSSLYGGGSNLVPGAGTITPQQYILAKMAGMDLSKLMPTAHASRSGVIEYSPGAGVKDITPSGWRAPLTPPRPIATDKGFFLPTAEGGVKPLMYTPPAAPWPGPPFELPPESQPQQLMPAGKGQNEPYKIGHVQEFKQADGTSIYRVYQGRDAQGLPIWADTELGGKGDTRKGFDTMDEAVSEAQRVLAKTPPDSGLVATAEIGPGNRWIPKLVPNITLRIPPTMPTQTPGVGFDKVKKQWFENMPDGTQRILSSEEVKQRRLQFMEETPVTDIKTMQQSVPSVLQLIKQARADMKKAESSLGPAAGRWSEFYSGKIGADNPDFRRLMTDIGLLQTRLMKMHVGARGGVEMMNHFERYFNAAKDSPANLKAAFDVVEQYANEVGMPLAEQKKAIGKPTVPEPTTEERTVIKQYFSPSTGKTKLVYSDGTEEIR